MGTSTTVNFKSAFKEDYGLVLTEHEATEAGERVVQFFDLLLRFDQEDKRKESKMEKIQDGK